MSLTVSAEKALLTTDADGVVRVGGTRVTLDTVVAAFQFRPKVAFRLVRKAIFNNEERKRLYKEAREYLALRAKRKRFVKDHKSQKDAAALLSAGD